MSDPIQVGQTGATEAVLPEKDPQLAAMEARESALMERIRQGASLPPLEEGITIEPYKDESQLPVIMELIGKDLSEPYSVYTYRYFIHGWKELCQLAWYKGEIIGVVIGKLDHHRGIQHKFRGYIAMLAVVDAYRGKKLGTALVMSVINSMISMGAAEVCLETEVTNIGAMKLYERLGFVRDKRLHKYYLNGVDAFRLKLWLTLW